MHDFVDCMFCFLFGLGLDWFHGPEGCVWHQMDSVHRESNSDLPGSHWSRGTQHLCDWWNNSKTILNPCSTDLWRHTLRLRKEATILCLLYQVIQNGWILVIEQILFLFSCFQICFRIRNKNIFRKSFAIAWLCWYFENIKSHIQVI